MSQLLQKHLLIWGNTSNSIKDEDQLKDVLKDLVQEVNMKIATPPQAHYVEDIGNLGLTGTIGLSTSHSSVHQFDDGEYEGMVQIDLYSCSDFDTLDVIRFLSNRLNLEGQIRYKEINRADPSEYDRIYFGDN